MAKKKKRGRPPLPKHLKKTKAKKGKPGRKPKAVKAKAKPKSAARARKAASRPRALAKSPKPAGDLVAGKYCVTAVAADGGSELVGIMLKESALTLEPHFAKPGTVPFEAFAVFESREDARLVVERFHPPARTTAPDDYDLGFADAPAAPHVEGALAPEAAGMLTPVDAPETALQAAETAPQAPEAAPLPSNVPPLRVAPLKEYFATSYEVELSNELVRTVKPKGEATTLGQAVRAVRDELAGHVKTHEKQLKEFDAKVAKLRKDNLYDVNTARTALDKFLKAAARYA